MLTQNTLVPLRVAKPSLLSLYDLRFSETQIMYSATNMRIYSTILVSILRQRELVSQ